MWLHDSMRMIFNGPSVVAHLMEAGKMSDSNKDEYISNLLSHMYNTGKTWDEEVHVTEVFKRQGFFKKFLNMYFDVSFTGKIANMSMICRRVSFYASMLNQLDIATDDVYVRHIVDVFSVASPYLLKDWFMKEKMSDEAFATKLRQRVAELRLVFPKSIEPKQDEEEVE